MSTKNDVSHNNKIRKKGRDKVRIHYGMHNNDNFVGRFREIIISYNIYYNEKE